MNFNQSKNIFKEWNKHVDNLLTEITDEEFTYIEKAFDKAVKKPNSLPFDSQFDGKLRKVVAISYDPYLDEGILGKMLNELLIAGWKVDLNTGLASKQTEREFEGVKRIQTRQMKVNAIWTTFLDLLRKQEDKMLQAFRDGFELDNIAELIANDPEIAKIDSQLKTLMGETITKQYSSGMAFKIAEKRINEFVKVWQTEAAKLKGKISQESTYSVVFSRHPVDVLRMSDFKNITSCHSPASRPTGTYAGGGSYYNCAIAEARDGGAIAYLVKTEDLKGVNLEERDIFSDEIRGQQLVDPIARIRLRVLLEPETQTYIAVPEKRVYGTNIKGFEETVSNWAVTSQAQQFDSIVSISSEDKEIDLNNFYRLGGMYQDNWIEDLFSHLKERVPLLKDYMVIGGAKFISTTQTEVDVENLGNIKPLAKNEIELFNKNMENKNIPLICNFKDTLIEVEGDTISIFPHLYYYYDIPIETIKGVDTKKYLASIKLAQHLAQHLEEFGIEKKFFNNGIEAQEEADFIRIKLYPTTFSFTGESYIDSIDALADFLSNIYYTFSVKDNMIESLNILIKYWLSINQIINGGELISLNQYIEDEEYKSDNIDWELHGDKDKYYNPSVISADLNIQIPLNKIKNLQALESNIANKKFINAIKASIYEFPEFEGLSVFFDIEQQFYIYIKIYLDDDVDDKYVAAARQMFLTNNTETVTKKMIVLINKMFPKAATVSSQTKLQEFKHVSNRWKMFLN